jgi:hypothetical protein
MSLSINYSFNILRSVVVLISFILLSGCASEKAPAAHILAPAKEMRVAVLPLENLSGRKAPFKEIQKSLIDRVRMLGVRVLEDDAMEAFMIRHRMRYMGGTNADISQALKEEEQVDAALITSLELYQEEYPPKIGIISRLVSTGPQPVILWMDSIGMAGDDSPGILGLGLINNPVTLRDKALSILSHSLGDFFALKGEGSEDIRGRRRYRPKVSYRSSYIESGKTYTVAPLPFFNISERKNAEVIVMLHFINALIRQGGFVVVEPGLIRQQLLHARIIMYNGVSLSDAYYIAHSLDADLILAGRVTDYQDISAEGGNPVVNFSATAIERESRKVVWASESQNQGNDEVFFYDAGKLNTASALASEMARSVATKMSGRFYQEDEQVEFMDVR